MINSKVRSQLLGKRPSAAPIFELMFQLIPNVVHDPRSPDNPTLVLTFALEVALIPAAGCCSVGHIQRVPAEPSMHGRGPLFVGYGLTPLGVGGYGLAVSTSRPQPRLRWRGVKEDREHVPQTNESSCCSQVAAPTFFEWAPSSSPGVHWDPDGAIAVTDRPVAHRVASHPHRRHQPKALSHAAGRLRETGAP
eukprot:scaffold119167_cov49-Phaeocystis_antarctica.AAC.2